MRSAICNPEGLALSLAPLGLEVKASAGSTKLTTLSKVEGPVEEPAHPIPAVGISAYPLRGLRERVVAFIVKGDPKPIVQIT